MAVPAKRGVWKTIKLEDGTEVRAELCGDERRHFWRTEDGTMMTLNKHTKRYAPVKKAEVMLRKSRFNPKQEKARRLRRSPAHRASSFEGTKRGLVILVNFKDEKFKAAHNKALYEKIMNTEGYTDSNGFKGSVRDYFKAQSRNKFDLQFDVAGPVLVSQSQAYYGGNDDEGNDSYPATMVIEACKLVDNQVNFKDYDWNDDGEVDQVYVVYAGKGEADSGEEDTIWPHEYSLSEAQQYDDGTGPLTLDGVKIDTYACGSEVDASGQIEGIGTFCHEFSHCLGYPDMYDTDYMGHFGMGDFDLMCSGSYNGNGFVPAGYTAWEKWVAGWLEPTELSDEDRTISNMKPMSEGDEAYIIYNQAHPSEYYLIENRQLTNWDRNLPGRGLMVTHVDYDADKFAYNVVNTVYSEQEAYDDAYDYYSYYVSTGSITEAECEQYCQEYVEAYSNEHERMTIVHADNDDDSKYWNSNLGYYTKTTTGTDLFPYAQNDSLTNYSVPAATLYYPNANGYKYLNRGIYDITQNRDGTMSFRFQASVAEKGGLPAGCLFYEPFEACEGTGGNDGQWQGTVASGNFASDNEGWVCTKGFSADGCAKFGTSSAAGSATTPAISLNGEATLTFKAAAWNVAKESTTLKLSATGGTVSPAQVTMKKGEWTEYSATVTGTGNLKITFASSTTKNARFFLDEVIVAGATGIEPAVVTSSSQSRQVIYDLSGRRVGKPSRGLYIVNGRKVIVR